MLLADTLDFLERPDLVHADDIHCDGGQVGDGYGVPTNAMTKALELTARAEGLLLDPVYTGKAMAGLIAAARAGELAPDVPVVFLHTGGQAALFAYQEALS